MGLSEEELEPDDGTSVSIEQPTEIKTPPLSMDDQDDRVRMVFGLTHDDPIPIASPETLVTYYRYLAANLKFPLFSFIWEKSGSFSRKKVMVPISRLDPPVEDEFDAEAGLYGIGVHQEEEIEFPLEVIDLKKQDPNFRLIDDYTYWSHTWREIESLPARQGTVLLRGGCLVRNKVDVEATGFNDDGCEGA